MHAGPQHQCSGVNATLDRHPIFLKVGLPGGAAAPPLRMPRASLASAFQWARLLPPCRRLPIVGKAQHYAMASTQHARGAFIVLEGADRAGKSTQCQMLVEHLQAQGVAAELWRFPDRTTAIGKMINSYLTSQSEIDDAAVHLLFSANRWEKKCAVCGGRTKCLLRHPLPTAWPLPCRDALLQKLQAGTTLVVDRYAFSGVAFTAAKAVPGLDRAWCMAPDAGLPAPDAVFFLNLTVEQAAARGGYGEERYEKADLQARAGGGQGEDQVWEGIPALLHATVLAPAPPLAIACCSGAAPEASPHAAHPAAQGVAAVPCNA